MWIIFLEPTTPILATLAFGLLMYLGYTLIVGFLIGLKGIYPMLNLYTGIAMLVIAGLVLIAGIITVIYCVTHAKQKIKMTIKNCLNTLALGLSGGILGLLIAVILDIPYVFLGMFLFYPRGVEFPEFYEHIYLLGFGLAGFMIVAMTYLTGALYEKAGLTSKGNP